MPKSVLVIDAIATHRIRFAALLESAHYSVSTLPHASELVGQAGEFDLVVLGLPEDQPGGTVSELFSHLGGIGVPIICLDAKSSSLRRVLALRAGAREVLPSKSPDDLLLARVRGLIRESEAEREGERRRMTAVSFGFSEAASPFETPAQIMCIGPLGKLPEQLAALLPHRIVQMDADAALEDDGASIPDAFILGHHGGPPLVERVLPDLRDRMHMRPAPIIVVYPADRPDIATRALALGATEVVVDTAGLEEFEIRLKSVLARKHIRDALRRSDEQSYRLAATDPLTGLYNRRYAETYLSDLTSRRAQQCVALCLVLVDLDHFKAVNDRHGHVAGDQVLCEVAHRLQSNLRACDLVARYGGEEFLIVLPETAAEEAAVLSERLRAAIAARPVRLRDGDNINVTASIGVAPGLLPPSVSDRMTGTFNVAEGSGFDRLQPVLEAADSALYRAKETGRNRVEISAA